MSYFIVKRKAVPAAGSMSDTCLTVGQNYNVIYAYGQLTANASHSPASALEIISDDQKSNQDFYQARHLSLSSLRCRPAQHQRVQNDLHPQPPLLHAFCYVRFSPVLRAACSQYFPLRLPHWLHLNGRI